MLTIFGDESHDEAKQKVYTVVGIIAPQETWDFLYVAWKGRMGEKKIFHAADCEADKGDFQNNSHEQNLSLYKDMVTILASSKFDSLGGFGGAINIEDFKICFPNEPISLCYLLCFMLVTLTCSMIIAEESISHSSSQKGRFRFDNNRESYYNALQLYNEIINIPGIEFEDYFDSVSFESRNEIGIQCADLFAREVMKDFYNLYFSKPKREIRKSWMVLHNTERFHYIPINKEALLFLRKKCEDINPVEFGKWTSKYKLDDSTPNRIKYLFYRKKLSA